VIILIDYGMGNLRSIYMALVRLDCQVKVSNVPADIRRASALVLPGQGAFGDAMADLQALGLIEPLVEALQAGIPYLGICLGLQLLFEASDEQPGILGLGLLPGRIVRFGDGLTVPQIGWNQVHQECSHPLWDNLAEDSYFYFVHSYYAQPALSGDVIGTTEYGCTYVSAVARGTMLGIQFHPEKSQDTGEAVLRNFVRMCA